MIDMEMHWTRTKEMFNIPKEFRNRGVGGGGGDTAAYHPQD